MFTLDELNATLRRPEFLSDYAAVRQGLASERLRRPFSFDENVARRLDRFIEAVLASVNALTTNEAGNVLRCAAESAELMARSGSPALRPRHALRAAILHELADMPAVAGAVAAESASLPAFVRAFFSRKDIFGPLLSTPEHLAQRIGAYERPPSVAALGLSSSAEVLAKYEQGAESLADTLATTVLAQLASSFDIGLSVSEARAFSAVVSRRASRATRGNLADELVHILKRTSCPSELWGSQVAAIRGGALDDRYRAWGFASPTGTGKTFLTRLLIADVLARAPEKKILYVVPSRALVNEVATTLTQFLRSLNARVLALSAQLVELESAEDDRLAAANVIVLTPEKADLLLRLGAAPISDVSLVIVDEAHHIEAGTRGILLELYLWRLKRLAPDTRYVFLSAVAPNIRDIASWISDASASTTVENRSTRMRAGVFRIVGRGSSAQGIITYTDQSSVTIVERGADTTVRRGICQLAYKLRAAGPVLVVAKGKRECESIASEMQDYLREQSDTKPVDRSKHDIIRRLDSRLQREMYNEVTMRDFVPYGIAYHHAGLPPRVRLSVEEAIREGLIDYVFATTTLAEGVNFPFSSVIVQSLVLKGAPEKGRPARYTPVTPRSFWNIAGRAGRPGWDREGQAILYEPSLGTKNIRIVLEPYLNPNLTGIEPVRSALADSIRDIVAGVQDKDYSIDDFGDSVLPSSLPRHVHGAINLLRVGIVHAKAAKLGNSPEEIVAESFAARFLSDATMQFARKLIASQANVIDRYVARDNAPTLDVIAKLGLSIETLSNLSDYVRSLEDWRIRAISTSLLYGPRLNLDQVKYIVGPVAKRMAELEGPTLGGLYSELIVQWLSGVPFTRIRATTTISKRIEDLIAVIYSRVQYLLPWGLYAMDELVKEEAAHRDIGYDGQILKLAYLADAGVPSFDALRLTSLDIERVDATRLADAYLRAGGLRTGLDVVGWVLRTDVAQLERAIRGNDQRPTDFDFVRLLNERRLSS